MRKKYYTNQLQYVENQEKQLSKFTFHLYIKIKIFVNGERLKSWLHNFIFLTKVRFFKFSYLKAD